MLYMAYDDFNVFRIALPWFCDKSYLNIYVLVLEWNM